MISGIIVAKNAKDTIERALRSIDFCDEIIVIDDNSEDKTGKIAQKLGAKVYKRNLEGDYASQRNFGLQKAKGDWVFFLDTDEIVSENLKKIILGDKLKCTNYNGFFIKRRDIFLGKELKHGESGNIKLLRFARKNAGKWKRKVHEYWDIKKGLGYMKGEIIHYPHKNLHIFIDKISHYSKIHYKENEREGKRSNILKIIFYPSGKFLYNYFWKLAIFDGVHGFVISILMSFHSFISWSGLWLKKKTLN